MATKGKGKGRRKDDWVAIANGRARTARVLREQGRCGLCHTLVGTSMGHILNHFSGKCQPRRRVGVRR